jgi:ribosomal protein S18 acetylase RimI-like enzyme
MIQITAEVALKALLLGNQEELYALMQRIYVPVYEHLWSDKGQWYIDQQYSFENLKKELENPHALYYFVIYQSTTIGILRIIENEPLIDFKDRKASKLHRIYLDTDFQGKGIGRILIDWTQNRQRQPSDSILWLEAMDSQQAAIDFYEKLGFQKSSSFRLDFTQMHSDLRGLNRMWKNIE